MMPIIYRPDPPPVPHGHECQPPSDYFGKAVGRWSSEEPAGTIWECGVCGRHWVTQDSTFKSWAPVRWWHFHERDIIREKGAA